jgi:transcription-repair coupling factor (superfamily II helicase)
MYCQLLENAVRELKGEFVAQISETSVDIGIASHIPKTYISSDARRMAAYRRLAIAASVDEIASLRAELTQAYGPPPPAAERVIELAELRAAASSLRVRSLSVVERDVIFKTPHPEAVVERLSTARGVLRVLPATSSSASVAARHAARFHDPKLDDAGTTPKTTAALSEVFYRPPDNYLVPATLLTVLRAKLCS